MAVITPINPNWRNLLQTVEGLADADGHVPFPMIARGLGYDLRVTGSGSMVARMLEVTGWTPVPNCNLYRVPTQASS